MDREASQLIVGIWSIAFGVVIGIGGITAKTFYAVVGVIMRTTSREVDPTLGRILMCVVGLGLIAGGIFFVYSGSK